VIDFPANPTNGQQFTVGNTTWVWDGTKWTTVSGVAPVVTEYLPLVGGTLTGPLILAADPTIPLGASTKEYVDVNTGAVLLSNTPPLDAKVGALWWDTVGGNLYVWFDDGTSQQWVAASNGFMSLPGWLPITGGTLTGDLGITGDLAATGTGTFNSGVYANGVLSGTGPYAGYMAALDSPNGSFLAFNTEQASGGNGIGAYVGGLQRWSIMFGDGAAETGGDVGSDFSISSFDDTGAGIGPMFSINRASGVVTTYTTVIANGGVGFGNFGYGGNTIQIDYDYTNWACPLLVNGGYVIGAGFSCLPVSFADSTFTPMRAIALEGASSAMVAWYSPSAAVSWAYGACDIRLKSNIEPATKDALAAINSLSVCECDLIQPPSDQSQHWNWAVVADEALNLAIPNALLPATEHTYANIRELPVIAALIKAVQQLTARVEELEAARA
jgi:hypothetical protein